MWHRPVRRFVPALAVVASLLLASAAGAGAAGFVVGGVAKESTAVEAGQDSGFLSGFWALLANSLHSLFGISSPDPSTPDGGGDVGTHGVSNCTDEDVSYGQDDPTNP